MKIFKFFSELSDRKHIQLDRLEKMKLICFAVAYSVMAPLAVIVCISKFR
jgi:hypothetical protein